MLLLNYSPQFENILNAIPIKIPASFFMDINKVILKSIWKGKGTTMVPEGKK